MKSLSSSEDLFLPKINWSKSVFDFSNFESLNKVNNDWLYPVYLSSLH